MKTLSDVAEMETTLQIPESYRKDIHRAVTILKEAACSHVYLFGALGGGRIHRASDIDLAIRGCPKGQFIHLLGRLLRELEHPVDLIRLDTPDAFAHYLEKEGELHRVG